MAEGMSGLLLIVATGLLVATIYGPWQWYCVDLARQELFEIRARIFNLAADEKIAFDSPHYQAIRDTLNGLLRFTHRVCWQQMLVMWWAHPHLPMESRLTRHVRLVDDPEVRALLEKEVRRTRAALVKLIVHRSPLLWTLMCGWRLCSSPRVGRNAGPKDNASEGRRRILQSAGERIAVEAESVGPFLDRLRLAA